MATCRDVIFTAFRHLGLLKPGGSLAGEEVNDSLNALQWMMDGLAGFGIGENLSDVEITATDDLSANSRALVNITTAATLTLPETPCNGARVQVIDLGNNLASHTLTLDGNGRKIEDSSTLALSTSGIDRTWIYRADTANWQRISALALEDDFPLPEFEVFAMELAIKLAPMFMGQVTPEFARNHQRAWNLLRARYRQIVVTPADDGVRWLSRQTFRPDLGI